jgi:peptidoglycan-associated lipoprotein
MLGERRARATKNFLVGQGIPATRITTVSYVEEHPRCSEKNEACWSSNRRAHVLVKPG